MGSIHFSLLARTSFALSRPLYELSSSAGNLRENIPKQKWKANKKRDQDHSHRPQSIRNWNNRLKRGEVTP